jgi:uncharacterized protein (TIGR02466 family)
MMSFAEVETRNLFPTPLFVASLSAATAASIKQQLVPILLHKAASEPSAQITNVGGWQSDTRLTEWGGEPVQQVIAAMTGLINNVTMDLHAPQSRGAMPWKVYGWANVNRKGHMNVAHTHPGSYWSAAYCVQTADIGDDETKGGEFQLIDPRGTLPITYRPQLRIGLPEYLSCGGHILHQPKEGQCLLFPSWLPHAVMPYRGEGTRISLAFNFSV